MNNQYYETIQQIKEILHTSDSAVFFGGAGVSTDSGIPDFRSAQGLYKRSKDSSEYLLSCQCLQREPQKFFDFYRNNMLYPSAEPNTTHRALAKLEDAGVIRAVITQNIDGLHQQAGSENVIELHGTVHANYCTVCGEVYDMQYVLDSTGIPHCTECGALVRPDVVLYGEGLNTDYFLTAEALIAQADVLIVGGTSLTVNPAASLVRRFRGKHLIIINKTPTPYDWMAEYVIRAPLAEVFELLAEQ